MPHKEKPQLTPPSKKKSKKQTTHPLTPSASPTLFRAPAAPSGGRGGVCDFRFGNRRHRASGQGEQESVTVAAMMAGEGGG